MLEGNIILIELLMELIKFCSRAYFEIKQVKQCGIIKF